MDGLIKLHGLTARSFAKFGMHRSAYVKSVETGDGRAYAVHAADGSYLFTIHDREAACAALRQHEIEPLSVH